MLFEDSVARRMGDYPWAKEFIQTMWNNPWNVEEFNFNSDIQDFKVKLTNQEQGIILRALSAIAQIEVSVKNFWRQLGDNLPPLNDLGSVMANVETVHNFAYEKLIDVLDMSQIFEDNLKIPVVAGRINYLRKHTHRYYENSKKQYLYAIILFSLFVENVSLFSQFYIINYFAKSKNILKNVNQQILYTKNEETIHFLVGAKIVNTIREEYPELFDDELVNTILKNAKEGVEHEIKISNWIIGEYDKDDDVSRDVVAELQKFRMNKSLESIHFPKIYDIDIEKQKKFWWFEEEILATNYVDFFNQRSVDYSKNNKSFGEEDLF
jgi:ribonucleoside-diphosphate reductase beta chain